MSGAPAARCIWIVSKYASPREYGFETRFFALARQWARLGRQVVVIGSNSNHLASFPELPAPYVTETIEGCVVRWVRTLRYRRTASLRRVLSWLHFEWRLLRMPTADLPRPDVVIASSLSLFTILTGFWLRWKFGCRLIFEVRDIWPLTMVEEGGFSAWHPLALLMGWVERVGYRRADLVVGTMPNLGEHVARVAGPGIRCECVPFGFDPAFYEVDPPVPERDLLPPIPPGALVVGYAGSIGVTNALDTIMRCVGELRGDPRFYFVFLGDGDCRERYQAESRDFGNVSFPGKVERAMVQSVLRRCDLLYFAVHDSAVWRYGMSLNKLIDYMMAAKPILGSYSGFPSMLNEARCGEFVPAADSGALKAALDRFAAMPAEQRAAMGRAGREWLVANRPWRVVAERYLRVGDSLLAGSHG